MPDRDPTFSRRSALTSAVRGAGILVAGGALASLAAQRDNQFVWQIDPYKCIQCGKCATECVLSPSAVKCLNVFPICGYCRRCTGYFVAWTDSLNEGAENQLCPTGALKRKFVEGDYYEYTVNLDECIGCARCVKGCLDYGNGSLFLQIDQSLCEQCNQCGIASKCPSNAISRIPAEKSYILVNKTRNG